MTVKTTTVRKISHYSRFICDQIAREYNIVCRFKPSIVASSCIMLSRQLCGLANKWTNDMKNYTTYSCDIDL